VCADPRCGASRGRWPQYVGFGDWWASHVPVERMVAAMLDDPLAHIGSLGFDIVERLVRGEAEWLPTNLPDSLPANASRALTLDFVRASSGGLPWPILQRLGDRATAFTPDEAVCVAALLSDTIAGDGRETERWMEAVSYAARGAVPCL